MASSEASNTNEVCGTLPISSNVDIAWEWGELKNPNNKKHVTCRLCAKSMHGGINRLKEHLLQIRGNVTSCPKATIEIMKKLRESMSSKKLKRAMKDRIDSFFEKGDDDDDDNDDGGGDNAGEEDDDVVEVDHEKDGDPPKASGSKSDATSKKKVGGGASKKLKAASDVRGPLDAMLKTDIDKTKQATLDKNNPIKEKLKLEAWRAIVEWTTEAGIAFNAVRCPSFKNMIYKIGEYGRAMPPPSYHQVRTNLFSYHLDEAKKFVESFRPHWQRYGCSIMSDFWTDGKGRALINFLVNCPKGTVFLKSVDASDKVKDADLIVQLVNEVVLDVGEENIVQFITDNGSNFKLAGTILQEQHPKLFWTPCAAHCVNLMLQDLGEKLPKIKKAVTLGKSLVTYIYNHGRVLSMMRELTGGKELHRSCVTRFATSFYTLKSIHENRHSLQMLFVSEKWMASDFANKPDGKKVMTIASKQEFWDNVFFSCQVLAPLVDVVRLVDTEQKPCMPYIYEAMDRAKEQIEKNLISSSVDDRVIRKIFQMIDRRWDDQLHHPLHAAGFYLNPSIFYTIPQKDLDKASKYKEIKYGLYSAIDKLLLDPIEHDQAMLDLKYYGDAMGMFGSPSAKRHRDKLQPYDWWLLYGLDVPCLQTFAVRILSQTCSASPCERNWSAFDNIHSKKRNRFLQAKLNDVVFVQYNKKLRRRYEDNVKYNVGDENDPIFLKELDENDEWIKPIEEEAQDFVREGDDLTWTQVREALGATEAGPSTRKRKQTSTDSIPRFSLLDESDEDDGFDIEVEEVNVGRTNDGNDGRGKKKMTDGNGDDDDPNMLS